MSDTSPVATPQASDATALAALSVIATLFNVGMFLANSWPLRHLWTNGEWGVQRPAGIFGLLLGTTWWSTYGLIIALPALVACNVLGFLIGCIGVFSFAKFAATRVDARRVVATAAIVVGGSVAIILLVKSGVFIHRASTQDRVLGLCASTSSVLMFSAPLSGAAEIVATKDASRLSLAVLSFSLVTLVLWTLYGLMVGDPMMIVPNVGGLTVTLLQAALFWKYGGVQAPPAPGALPLEDAVPIQMTPPPQSPVVDVVVVAEAVESPVLCTPAATDVIVVVSTATDV